MIAFDHVIEIALLMLLAYLAGCVLGYAGHMALRAYTARPRLEARRPVPAMADEATKNANSAPIARSAARRLAGTVERETSQPPAAMPSQQRPPDLPAPREGGPDNLRQVKGIGPKTESALNDLGIYHLDQIAAWSPAHIDWLEGRIAVKGRIRREQWVEQAILLVTATTAA